MARESSCLRFLFFPSDNPGSLLIILDILASAIYLDPIFWMRPRIPCPFGKALFVLQGQCGLSFHLSTAPFSSKQQAFLLLGHSSIRSSFIALTTTYFNCWLSCCTNIRSLRARTTSFPFHIPAPSLRLILGTQWMFMKLFMNFLWSKVIKIFQALQAWKKVGYNFGYCEKSQDFGGEKKEWPIFLIFF